MRIIVVILLAIATNGCSANLDDTAWVYVSPGKFSYTSCAEIQLLTVAASKREKELLSVMERAKNDASGAAVNAVVYGPRMTSVREELRQLRSVAMEKKCVGGLSPRPSANAQTLAPIEEDTLPAPNPEMSMPGNAESFPPIR